MKTILLLGKNGQVGWELQHALLPIGRVIALDRTQLDLTRPDDIRKTIRDLSPDIIVNAAGYTTVDKAEAEPAIAMLINATAPGILAEEAKRRDALLVHYSTDYVYDGTRSTPYDEEDAPNPLNVYGKSKLAGERAIVAAGCKHLILRASWIYSARGTNFVLTMLRLARERSELPVVNDQVGSPSWAKSLALSTAEILSCIRNPGGVSGIYHLSATGHTTRLDFAKLIIDIAKHRSNPEIQWAKLNPITTENYPLPAARPLFAATSKAKIKQTFGAEMPTWQEQLKSFMLSLQDAP